MKWDEAGKRRRRDRRIFTPDEGGGGTTGRISDEGRGGDSSVRGAKVQVVAVIRVDLGVSSSDSGPSKMD